MIFLFIDSVNAKLHFALLLLLVATNARIVFIIHAMDHDAFIRHRKPGYVKKLRRKVYVSGTASLADEYLLEYLVKDVLDAYDCDVYLRDHKKNIDPADLALLLQEMDAYVLYLSEEYFDSIRKGTNDEIDVILHNGKKVIPLLHDPEFSLPSYNEFFKNVQYIPLDFMDEAKAHRGKLQIVLEDLFDQDQSLSEKATFDRRIFLSYRKKNRAIAKKLIETIHLDPRLEGVEIWYDEFLNPGEDFESDIEEQLLSSDHVLLLLTSEMMEANNYVIETEYPLILKLEKPVTPVKVHNKASKSNILTAFPRLTGFSSNLPYPFHSLRPLCDRLAEALGLENYVRAPKDDFHIGMLYMNGVRVEYNPQKGAKLILSAARRGYVPAYPIVAKLFYDGLYLPGNLDNAVYYNSEYIEYARKNEDDQALLLALYNGSFYHARNYEWEDYNLLQSIFYHIHVGKKLYSPELAKNTRERVRILLSLGQDEDAKKLFEQTKELFALAKDEQEQKRIHAEEEVIKRYLAANEDDFIEASMPIENETIESYPFLEKDDYRRAVMECQLYVYERFLHSPKITNPLYAGLLLQFLSFSTLQEAMNPKLYPLRDEDMHIRALLDVYLLLSKTEDSIVKEAKELSFHPVLDIDEDETFAADRDIFRLLFRGNANRYKGELVRYFLAFSSAAEKDENYVYALLILRFLHRKWPSYLEDYEDSFRTAYKEVLEEHGKEYVQQVKKRVDGFLWDLGLRKTQ